jgi:hypothetical protein
MKENGGISEHEANKPVRHWDNVMWISAELYQNVPVLLKSDSNFG